MRSTKSRFFLASILFLLSCLFPPAATAQTRTLRIVCYNIAADVNGATSPLPGLIAPPTNTADVQVGGVLEGIGEEVLGNDPAQPLDILALEETTSSNLTIGPILNGLNTFYNASNMYATSPYQATESGNSPTVGNGPNALVYNTYTVQLIASVPVDPPGGTSKLGSSSGEYREVMRYEFAPAGMTPAPTNEFYIYVSHYKASTGSANEAYRLGEAQIIRNNETNLPSSARVIYVGDYNVDTSAEAGYQTILAAASPGGVAQGQGIDPLNVSGSTNIDWEDTTTNKAILLMLTEEDYKLRYRDDLQIMTSNVFYAAPGGLCLVTNTYHAFGNNGSLTYGSSVTASTNTALNDLGPGSALGAPALYFDLTNASDHLPVVADYTIPVSVPPLELMANALSLTNGVQFAVSNTDGTTITAGQASRISVSASTNLINWTALTNSISLTNGVLEVQDTNGLVYSSRYYRAVEKP